MISIESSAKTVQKAIEDGLEKLNKTIDEVDIKIISSGGLFRKARVEISVIEAEKPMRAVRDNKGERNEARDNREGAQDNKGDNLDIRDNKGEHNEAHDNRGERSGFSERRSGTDRREGELSTSRRHAERSVEKDAKGARDGKDVRKEQKEQGEKGQQAQQAQKEQREPRDKKDSRQPAQDRADRQHSDKSADNQHGQDRTNKQQDRAQSGEQSQDKAQGRTDRTQPQNRAQEQEKKPFDKRDRQGAQDRAQKPAANERPERVGRPDRQERPERLDRERAKGESEGEERGERTRERGEHREGEERHERPRTPVTDEIAEQATNFVQNLLSKMGIDFALKTDAKEGELFIDIECGNGAIIGYRGETLDSIEYLTSLVINKSDDKYYRINVDCNDYRTKRVETLSALARRMAEKAIKTGHKVVLEPMSSSSRKIIHSILSENDRIITKSEGKEPTRRIIIIPKRFR